MRNYIDNEIKKIKCNVCGNSLKIKEGILQEGCFHVDYPWGYFSDKDGMIHHFDICESCYNKWIKTFTIPVEEEESKELF